MSMVSAVDTALQLGRRMGEGGSEDRVEAGRQEGVVSRRRPWDESGIVPDVLAELHALVTIAVKEVESGESTSRIGLSSSSSPSPCMKEFGVTGESW